MIIPDPETGERRLLIVTSQYPPMGGTNVQRVFKLTKVLPTLGWKPWVVTLDIPPSAQFDAEVLRELPDAVTVVRSANLDPFVFFARGRSGPRRDPRAGDPPAAPAAPAPDARTGKERRSVRLNPLGWLSSLTLSFLRYFVFIPDGLTLWVPTATIAAYRALRAHRIPIVMSSAPSYSSHLVGLLLKRLTGRPWIADFRDLWVGRPYRPSFVGWRGAWDATLERAVVRSADRILCASPRYIDHMRARHGAAAAEKSIWIPVGYDANDFPDGGDEGDRSPELRVVCVGFSAANLTPFFQALERVSAGAPELTGHLEIRLMGSPSPDDVRSLQEFAATRRLGARVSFLGRLPHDACVRHQREADLLLLVLEIADGDTVRGQAFECMASGKPIFAVLPSGGILESLVRPSGLAIIAKQGEVDDIATHLEVALRQLRAGTSWARIDRDYVRRFETRNLAARVVGIIEELLEKSPGSGTSAARP
jgi:glycosyltransferase involved in cell wall biosynthesis